LEIGVTGSREKFLLIDESLKELKKVNPKQAPIGTVAIRDGKCNVSGFT
jgi:hypothetical protein